MTFRLLVAVTPVVLLLAAACAPTTSQGVGTPPPHRVLTTDMQGEVVRQQGLNDRASFDLAAPVAKVWPALLAAYSELGIVANFADQASGRFGVQGYAFPRRLDNQHIGRYFNCGSNLTGALVDQGKVTADVITTILSTDEGTRASIYMIGWLRRNDGNSADAIACASTGRLEERTRMLLQSKLASM